MWRTFSSLWFPLLAHWFIKRLYQSNLRRVDTYGPLTFQAVFDITLPSRGAAISLARRF